MIPSVFDDAKTNRKKIVRLLVFTIITWLVLSRIIFNLFLSFSDTKITAHRGSTIFSPENTLPSVVEAISFNVDFIEIDVQLTKDNKVILLHDETFKRVGGVDKRPDELTYEEVKQIDVGSYKSGIVFVTAPLLEEVIDLCKLSNTKLLIELKSYSKKGLSKEVVRIIKEKDYIDNCYVQSFDSQLIREVKAIEPRIKVGLLTYSPAIVTYANNLFVDFFSIYYLSITPRIELYLKDNNKELFCFTPSTKAEIHMAFNSGVDNVITNDVELARLLVLTKKKK
ncbi:MAG: hypothetical protein IKR04_06790 [Clostridia bacterium]|nr:hypothetical protein [Clostridia bacterium]